MLYGKHSAILPFSASLSCCARLTRRDLLPGCAWHRGCDLPHRLSQIIFTPARLADWLADTTRQSGAQVLQEFSKLAEHRSSTKLNILYLLPRSLAISPPASRRQLADCCGNCGRSLQAQLPLQVWLDCAVPAAGAGFHEWAEMITQCRPGDSQIRPSFCSHAHTS